jgi:hypothetical protein
VEAFEEGLALSDSTSTTASVVIPGELQLSNPVPPPVTVPLPMIAWPDEVKNFWSGLLCLAVGVMSLSTGLLCGLGLSGAFGQAGDGLSVSMVFVLTFMAVFGIGLGVGFVGAAFTCFWDAVRGDPVLEIGTDGLRDRRSGLSVPWSSVRSAGFLNGRLLSVDLQLRSPVTGWQNPVRIGVLFHRYRLMPDRMIVSVANLDASKHIVAYTILTLVRQNGGEVISKIPHGPEMYPRLIAQGAPANVRSSPVASAPAA